jgi:hypothetical protein
MPRRVGPRWQASGVTIDQVPGALNLDPTPSDDANHNFITGLEAGVSQHPNGERDLMFAGNLAQRFTSLPIRKADFRLPTSRIVIWRRRSSLCWELADAVDNCGGE